MNCAASASALWADVAAIKQEALTDRFGAVGRRAWELAQGIDDTLPWSP